MIVKDLSDFKPCKCCKKSQAEVGKPPRLKLPVQVKGAKAPTYLCTYCDGDAYAYAKKQLSTLE